MDDNNEGTSTDVNTGAVEPSATAAERELSFSNIKDSKGVTLENRWGEMARKLNKVSELDSKLDQVLNRMSAQQTAGTQDIIEEEFEGMNATQIARVIDQRLAAKDKESLVVKHYNDFTELKKQYPELDDTSVDYDATFYKLADSIYKSNGLSSSSDGAKEAVEYAAYKSGKSKKALETALLSDEARRSRTLSEGGTGSKKAKTSVDSDDEMLANAKAHFNINPKYFKQAKANLGDKS